TTTPFPYTTLFRSRDHAAPVLRDRALERDVGAQVDVRAAVIGLAERGDDRRGSAAAVAELARARLQPHAQSGLVDLVAGDVGPELERDRAELDGDLGLPLVLADDLGELGAGHARDHAR